MEKQITNFAIEPDENTINQFNNCIKEDFVIKASLMPDAHSGYVAPIGSVLVTKDYLVPAWVGYDIGCGMIACKIEAEKDIYEKIMTHRQEIFERVKELVPMGEGKLNHIQNISQKTKDDFKQLLNKFKESEYDNEILKYIKNKALSNLGTLGSGNHFLEIGFEEKTKDYWVIIHSGSRGIGHRVATKYMKKASQDEKNYEATNPLEDTTKEGKEYKNILNFGLEFALLNRLEMSYKVEMALNEIISEKIKLILWTNKNHNHAIEEEKNIYIHRKGATPAKKGERGVIPANMRDGCFLVEGLGNKDFLESSSHGAGRKMSRTEAKKMITLEDFKKTMKNITGTINHTTIDEAPDAYKNIFDVMKAQEKSVKEIAYIKPIINWKG